MTMLSSLSAFSAVKRTAAASTRISSLRSLSTMYSPSLTERRVGEAGRGGRNSEAGIKVALFGASGFLGHYVCGELGPNGFVGYLGNRGDEMEMRHLKMNFELGRSRFVFYSPRDVDSVKEVIANADVVVNMIGKYYETGQPVQTSSFPYLSYQTNYSFHDVNVKIPQMLAEVCLEMQVDHLIHVSSASASPDAISEWSRTKYEGEQAVKAAYPWATIIRPTQLFGKQDRLLNWYGRMASFYRMVPLLDGGKSLVQPVYVGDVAKTILRVCDDPVPFEGRQIDCFGPTDYTYEELAKFVDDITEQEKPTFPVPRDIFRTLAKGLQYTRDPLMTPDLVDIWSEDFLPTLGNPEAYKTQAKDDPNRIITMEDMGIKPNPIEKEAFEYLHFYRAGGHFFRVEGYH